MISAPEFRKKQIIFVFTNEGDKLSFSNDNIIVKDKGNAIKHQSTCYKLFMLVIVGNVSITSGLLQRSNRFGFSICLMNRNMKVYQVIGGMSSGNTLLHKHQYEYNSLELAKHITENKLKCQRDALKTIRNRTDHYSMTIMQLSQYAENIKSAESLNQLMGLEGTAAREYFSCMFDNVDWKGRKPRIKTDYVNAILDVGYNILFNLIDAILSSFGFDTYYGVMHRCFYRRKSLVCDVIEPFRPIIDLKVRKAINLGQFKEDDFEIMNFGYVLKWENSSKYVSVFIKGILEHKENIFSYIQRYYRCFMKGTEINEFPEFKIG